MSIPNPSTKKDSKLIAAVVLVGLIVVVGIVLVVVGAFSGDDKTAAPPGDTTATRQPGSSSACGLPDGDQTVPAAAPKAAWELSGKVAAPRNASYGPARYENAPRSCFAHNPTGAVFAAVNYFADTTNPIVTDKLISRRLFADSNSDQTGADGSDGSDNPTYQVSGFRVEDATMSRVSVAVVLRSTEGPTAGQQAAVTFTLGWQRGDWKIIVPPDGQPPTTAIASLSGYVAWSGV